MRMNSVVHFELPGDDQKRMSEFYAKVFGWKNTQLGAEMDNYVMTQTTETDEKSGFPKKPGAINGGLYKRSNNEQRPSIVIEVDDVYEHVEKIKAAGGKIVAEPMEIPGVGMYASFVDTEGNTLSILQPKM